MSIKKMIAPRHRALGGFSVRRILPLASQPMVGPWIFFDHFGPVDFEPSQGMDVRPHPHINLATVTYLFAGEILHRDSVGSQQTIRPGDLNLMVAGKGITHSERTPTSLRATGHQLHGLQLWCALPEADEETDPAFYHHPAKELPEYQDGTVHVRVMMGAAYGLHSPVKTFAQTLYLEANLQTGDQLQRPNAEALAVYVIEGAIRVDDEVVRQYHMAVLSPEADTSLEAIAPSRIVLIGGEKMPPRYIEWNFISSRKARIEQAKDDWLAKRFPLVVGDGDEYIPLP